MQGEPGTVRFLTLPAFIIEKKMKSFLTVAAVAVGLMAGLQSCDPADDTLSAEEIASKLTGRWKYDVYDLNDVITNEKSVWTFNGNGEVVISQSSLSDSIWFNKEKCRYTISDNVITVTIPSDGDKRTFTVDAINSIILKCSKSTSVKNPSLNMNKEMTFHKVNVDYSKAILGTWQGTKMTGKETFGDEGHRWEFFNDGTYIYYDRDSLGNWVHGTNKLNEYIVDGDWLAFRWVDFQNIEYREYWDIDNLTNQMVWSATRKKENGGTDYTTIESVRVQE